MSFLGGGSVPMPDAAPKPLGVDDNRLSTSEQARPVPYFLGKVRLGLTFISDLFDARADEVTRDEGKQKSKVGYNYFVSFAALIGHGPLSGIHDIFLNGEKVWTGNFMRGVFSSIDSTFITIPGWGLVQVYWGTETQEPDAYLISKSGVQHPAYRGLAYMVFHQLFLGFNQTNVQNIEVIVSKVPTTTWVSNPTWLGSSVGDESLFDAQPMVLVADLPQNPRAGLGLPNEFFDQAGINATAAQLYTEQFGVSPLLTRSQPAKEVLSTLLEYIDGFIDASTPGQLSIGLARPPGTLAGLLAIDETVMTKKPEMSSTEWSTVYNSTRVKFFNIGLDFKEDASKPWRDRGAFQATGDFNPITLDRTWVTNPNLAAAIAMAAGRNHALPELTGTLSLRRTGTLFEQLKPGVMFLLSYAPRGLVNLACRVTERSAPSPATPEFAIKFRLDRSYITPTGTAAAGTPKALTVVTVPQIAQAALVELPLALCPEGKISLAALAARPDGKSLGYKIHLGENYDFSGQIMPTSFDEIGATTQFALRGTVFQDYPTTGLIDNALGVLVQLDDVTGTIDEQSAFTALAGDLLMFVDGEVLSVLGVELVAIGLYRLLCIRGRFATPMQAHSAGAEVWIIARSRIVPLQHGLFQVGNTAVVKLQAIAGAGAADLSLAAEETITLQGIIFQRPPPTNLRVNNSAVTAMFSTGAGIQIDWTMADGGRTLWEAHLYVTSTVLRFCDLSLNVLGTREIGQPPERLEQFTSLTLTNAELIALTGGVEQSFILQAVTKMDADYFIAESNAAQVAVTKV